MEKKINIAEILKDCPKGTKLYSPIFGNVFFEKVINNMIYINTEKEYVFSFDKYGRNKEYANSECLLFPSKDQRDWSTFQRPFKDGDVLSYQCSVFKNRSIYIYMYHHRMNTTYYVALSGDSYSRLMINDKQGHALNSYNDTVRFATEEEKQKLFNAIKTNGYKWNAETKTLEKLINRNKFTVGAIITNGKIKGKICSRDIDSYKLEDGTYVFFNEVHNWELVRNKFDINTLTPFESRVLVRDYDSRPWIPNFWGKCLEDDSNCRYLTTGGCYKCCIPYENNEHLLGTTDDCEDFYKTWEE